MIRTYKVLITIACTLFSLTAAPSNLRITDFPNTTVQCDYLIVCPDSFETAATQLATHRNSSSNDDVHYAKYVFLADILKLQSANDSLSRADFLRMQIRYAYKHWSIPPKYLVLMGDTRIRLLPDSTIEDYGLIPSVTNSDFTIAPSFREFPSDTTFTCSDMEFGNMDTSSNFGFSQIGFSIAVGRIPAENQAQCADYVNKVISYDSMSKFAVWRNRAIVVNDDQYQDTSFDYVGQDHLECSELISNSCLSRSFVSKVYLSKYPKDIQGIHTIAKEQFFNTVNKGSLLTIYFGHGHPELLSDEEFLKTTDSDLFHNDSTPTVFMSLSCSNGAFYRPIEHSMCKRFLLKSKGGAIIYLASSTLSYSDQNQRLAKSILTKVRTNTTMSYGNCVKEALSDNKNSSYYILMGDPALQIHYPDSLPKNESTITNNRLSVSPKTPFDKGNYFCALYSMDTVTAPDSISRFVSDSVLSSSSSSYTNLFTVDFPIPLSKSSRIVTYIWNDNGQCSFDTILNFASSVTYNPKSHIVNHTVTTNHDKVSIIASNKTPIVNIRLLDLRGKGYKAVSVQTSGTTTSISFNQAPGRYLLAYELNGVPYIKAILFD